MKIKLSAKYKKALYDWSLGVASAAIYVGITTFTNLFPGYALVIAALAAPAIKWADKHSSDYGRKN